MRRLTLALALPLAAVILLSGCSFGGRASVMDAKTLFERDRETYEALVQAALAASRSPDERGNYMYRRVSRSFWDLPSLLRFRYVSIQPPRAETSGTVSITVYAYGLSVSGRTVGLIYYEDGSGPNIPAGSSIRVFDDCAIVDLPENWVAYAYCSLGDGWYAFRHSY